MSFFKTKITNKLNNTIGVIDFNENTCTKYLTQYTVCEFMSNNKIFRKILMIMLILSQINFIIKIFYNNYYSDILIIFFLPFCYISMFRNILRFNTKILWSIVFKFEFMYLTFQSFLGIILCFLIFEDIYLNIYMMIMLSVANALFLTDAIGIETRKNYIYALISGIITYLLMSYHVFYYKPKIIHIHESLNMIFFDLLLTLNIYFVKYAYSLYFDSELFLMLKEDLQIIIIDTTRRSSVLSIIEISPNKDIVLFKFEPKYHEDLLITQIKNIKINDYYSIFVIIIIMITNSFFMFNLYTNNLNVTNIILCSIIMILLLCLNLYIYSSLVLIVIKTFEFWFLSYKIVSTLVCSFIIFDDKHIIIFFIAWSITIFYFLLIDAYDIDFKKYIICLFPFMIIINLLIAIYSSFYIDNKKLMVLIEDVNISVRISNDLTTISIFLFKYMYKYLNNYDHNVFLLVDIRVQKISLQPIVSE
jgi:hypothetical protein